MAVEYDQWPEDVWEPDMHKEAKLTQVDCLFAIGEHCWGGQINSLQSWGVGFILKVNYTMMIYWPAERFLLEEPFPRLCCVPSELFFGAAQLLTSPRKESEKSLLRGRLLRSLKEVKARFYPTYALCMCVYVLYIFD